MPIFVFRAFGAGRTGMPRQKLFRRSRSGRKSLVGGMVGRRAHQPKPHAMPAMPCPHLRPPGLPVAYQCLFFHVFTCEHCLVFLFQSALHFPSSHPVPSVRPAHALSESAHAGTASDTDAIALLSLCRYKRKICAPPCAAAAALSVQCSCCHVLEREREQ